MAEISGKVAFHSHRHIIQVFPSRQTRPSSSLGGGMALASELSCLSCAGFPHQQTLPDDRFTDTMSAQTRIPGPQEHNRITHDWHSNPRTQPVIRLCLPVNAVQLWSRHRRLDTGRAHEAAYIQGLTQQPVSRSQTLEYNGEPYRCCLRCI